MATTDTRPRHIELGLSDDDVIGMYRDMLLARAVDERMWLMQRAGKIAFIISGQGHEGAQVATSWVMRKGQDWMAPFYRSIASAMTFGMSAEDIITAHLAKADDVSSGGRQMPGHYGGARYNIVSLSSPVGTQVLHAVGIAMGAWVKGDDVVTMTQFGEGTSNQGEIHEAMNFAGVHKLPVIFVCENNGYAISVPLDQQVAGSSVAARAAGYDMPGVVVDGGDVLACYAAARDAHERARTGQGPTLIEARVVRLDEPLVGRRPAPLSRCRRGGRAQGARSHPVVRGRAASERGTHRRAGGDHSRRDQVGGQRGQQARRGTPGADAGRRP